MFYCAVCWFFSARFIDRHFAACTAITLLATIVVCSVGRATVPHIELVPTAFLFYVIGYGCKKLGRQISARLKESVSVKKSENFVFIIVFPILVIVSCANTPIAMYANRFGNIALFLAGAFSGIYLVCKFAQKFSENEVLCWIGRNSIIVYVLHFKLIKVLHGAGKAIFPQLDSVNYRHPFFWGYFLVCIFVLCAAVFVCERWFAPLFGKKNKRRTARETTTVSISCDTK